MANVETAVLKVLSDSDLWLSANNIAKNTGYTKGYVRKTCKDLLERGLVKTDKGPGNPFYRITDAGREYLEKGN